uniref:DUF1499 domain-containing protein n=1 Tax=Corethron hystrix TaxID=216773 RepID=A0A7S1BZD9_9STRA|mmetsp:Transcript_6249/g.13551  ORF Transcript_6249/g.13551 Transcript_6249/m.13551 type:complete len:248 (+) Transcript_6249:73-816(+)
MTLAPMRSEEVMFLNHSRLRTFVMCSILFIDLPASSVAWNIVSSTSHQNNSIGQGNCKHCKNREDFIVDLVGATSFLWWSLNPESAVAAPSSTRERGNAVDGLSDCPGQPVKKSCWSTEDRGGRRLKRWTPPVDLLDAKSPRDAVLKDLVEVVDQYPQKGQKDVDAGGWKMALAPDTSSSGAVYLSYEFTSGKFRYVDDLEFLVDVDGKVSVRSASRSGGFDFGVNAARLNYIMKTLQKKGWNIQLL